MVVNLGIYNLQTCLPFYLILPLENFYNHPNKTPWMFSLHPAIYGRGPRRGSEGLSGDCPQETGQSSGLKKKNYVIDLYYFVLWGKKMYICFQFYSNSFLHFDISKSFLWHGYDKKLSSELAMSRIAIIWLHFELTYPRLFSRFRDWRFSTGSVGWPQ